MTTWNHRDQPFLVVPDDMFGEGWIYLSAAGDVYHHAYETHHLDAVRRRGTRVVIAPSYLTHSSMSPEVVYGHPGNTIGAPPVPGTP